MFQDIVRYMKQNNDEHFLLQSLLHKFHDHQEQNQSITQMLVDLSILHPNIIIGINNKYNNNNNNSGNFMPNKFTK